MKEIIFKDWLVKLVVLLAAIVLWFYVASGSTRMGTFPGKVPVQIKNTPVGLVAILDQNEVSLKISADPALWSKLSLNYFDVYVDLSGLSSGVQQVDITALSKLSGVQILDKNPSRDLVRLEPIASKEVPVVVKFGGKAGEGYIPGVPRLEIDKVTVQGAKSVIDKILEATAIFPLDGEVKNIEKTISLVALDEKNETIKNVSFNPEKIDITVPIAKGASTKNLGIKVNLTGKVKSNFWLSAISTDPQEITLSGTPEALRDIQLIETKPLSIEGLDSSQTLTASLNIPSGTQIEGAKDTVQIIFTISPLNLENK